MTDHLPIAATGILARFAEARMIDFTDFHVARRLAALAGESDPTVMLAFALCVRELRQGSVCLDLSGASSLPPLEALDDGVVAAAPALDWPEAQAWWDSVQASPAVSPADGAPAPFRLVGNLLYLERYFQDEHRIRLRLQERATLPPTTLTETALTAALAPDVEGHHPDPAQEAAIRLSATAASSVITGGPGTGKTSTVARILDALTTDAETPPLVALAAPTGKAAGRLARAVSDALRTSPALSPALTLHSLVGAIPGRATTTHHRDHPLPYDVVVVDETSMVSLSMMAWLLDAVADDTRLILLGDPHQLASVEEGAVLADIARAELLPSAHLERNWRSNDEINRLAAAIQSGDADAALAALESSSCRLTPWEPTTPISSLSEFTDTLAATTTAVLDAATAGDADGAIAAVSQHRILCAHRQGPYGVAHWGEGARRWLTRNLTGYLGDQDTYPGQPLVMTRNNDLVSNGETAVIIDAGPRLEAAVEQPDGIARFDPAVLDNATDMHAMTIHRSQGSQFDAVTVVLPPLGSPLLTRELLYTAVTRARHSVRLYGSPEALREAVTHPTRRASGLH